MTIGVTEGARLAGPPEWIDDLPRGVGCRRLDEARWGYLLSPAATAPAPRGTGPALRVALFGSFWIGHAALRSILAVAARGPLPIRLVGVATDDPLSPGARISLRKRAWGLMAPEERRAVKLALLRRALSAGVPVYTGEVKTSGFREVFAGWGVDAVITCGFGQVLDRPLLDCPLGAYNCHPTDLLNGHGAGPAPWDDMTARGVHHTVWSVHQMTEVVDAGRVIGQTPPINVGDAAGRLPEDRRAFFFKALAPIPWMVLSLLEALAARRGADAPGLIDTLDIGGTMPPALRARLLRPVEPGWEATQIPEPGAEEFAALGAEAVPVDWGAAAV